MEIKTVLLNKRRSAEELAEMATNLVPEGYKAAIGEFVLALVDIEREDANARIERVRKGADDLRRESNKINFELGRKEGSEARREAHAKVCSTILSDLGFGHLSSYPPTINGVESAVRQLIESTIHARTTLTCGAILEELAVTGYDTTPVGVVAAMDKLVEDAVPDDDRFIEMQRAMKEAESCAKGALEERDKMYRLVEELRKDVFELQREVARLERENDGLSDLQEKLADRDRQLARATRFHRERVAEVFVLTNRCKELQNDLEASKRGASRLMAMDKEVDAESDRLREQVDALSDANARMRKELDEARQWLQAGSETKTVLRRERDAAQQQILELQRALQEARDNSLRLAGEVERLGSEVSVYKNPGNWTVNDR